MAYLLSLHTDGSMSLEKVGRRTYCRQIPEESMAELRALALAEEWRRLVDSAEVGHDWAEAHIEAEGVRLKVVIDQLPEQVVPLLREVDDLFREAFGARYDMPLLPPAD